METHSFSPLCLGHGVVVKYFESAIREGKLAPAWLFLGPQGVGKRTLAWALAYQLLAAGNQKAKHLLTQMQAGTHPDFFSASDMTAELLKSLLLFLQRKALAKTKVVLLTHIDTWHFSMAPALLKVLEMLPSQTFFLTTADKLQPILPTIRSRLTIKHLKPYKDRTLFHKDFTCLLKAHNLTANFEKQQTLFESSHGCLGYAFRLLTDKDTLSPLKTILFKGILPKNQPHYAPPLTSENKSYLDQFSIDTLFNVFKTWIEDLLVKNTLTAHVLSPLEQGVINKYSPQIWGEKLCFLQKIASKSTLFYLSKNTFYGTFFDVL